jgi:fluoride ion exporter CrcB/FEX
MIQNQQWSTLSLYVFLSLAVCIGAKALGFNLAK